MAITRREFLKDLGIGSAVLMAWRAGLISADEMKGIEEALARGEESWVTSVCQQCPGACGIRVRKIGSWPVAINGNPLHPINLGTLCPKGVAGLQAFYDPDRLRGPLKREGERGQGKWQKISWDEAIATVSGELKKIREAGRSHQVAVIGGRYRGGMRTLFERFLEAYGSPNYIDNSFARWQGPVEAVEATHGFAAEPRYDLDRAHYLLSFSAPLLDAGTSPVENLRGWADLRRGDPAHRGKIVQFDTRLSVTAAKADEWVPIHPGTEGWLALGFIYILLREDLYDDVFLGEHTNGFSNFKGLVLENYSLPMIAELTGVPIDTILRLAREFAAARPALAISGRIDPKDQITIYTLNALVGSINAPGGVLIPRDPEIPPLPAVVRDETASAGLAKGRTRPLTGDPYPLQALFCYYTNPLFSNPQGERIREAFSKIPLLVSFSPFMDETASFSDLILPDHTFLERWQDVPASTGQGFSLVGIAQPVRSPLYDTRPTGDLLLAVAKGLGDPIAKALPWSDYQDFLKEEMKRIFDSRKGDIFGTAFESSWTAFLARAGWWTPSYGNFEEFQTLIRERGGWWDPVYIHEEWGRIFRTASGKFEFPPLKDLPIVNPKGEGDFPLVLNSYPLMAMTGGRNANQAWLADIAGPHVQTAWKTWAEINPETGRKLGIKENDEVWIESPAGKIKGTARLYEGIHPDVIGVPVGFGHTAMGRWAEGIGENPRKIEETEPGKTVMPRERMTRVKVYKG